MLSYDGRHVLAERQGVGFCIHEQSLHHHRTLQPKSQPLFILLLVNQTRVEVKGLLESRKSDRTVVRVFGTTQ